MEPGVFKVSDDGKVESGKISEMLLEFGQPILYADPAGPPDLQALRSLLPLVELCWNLPMMERNKTPNAKAMKQQVEAVLAAVPVQVSGVLRQMLKDRLDKYGHIPVYVTARVEGTGMEDARIVAEARLAQRS